MVKSNGYTPTNKYFRNKFQDFASTKTKKGHLNNQEDEEGAKKLTGTLVKIDKKKMYSNGWLVETTDKKQYWCSYGDGVIALPDCTESENYYVPKKQVEVEISVDEDNKVYTLTRIKDPNKKPIALYNDKLEISMNSNNDTNQENTAKIEVSQNDVKIVGKTIADAFTANSINIEKQVETDTVIATQTITGKINANGIRTESISFFDDDEPTITPTLNGVGINNGIVTPTILTDDVFTNNIEGKKLKVENISLGQEDLQTRLSDLEERIRNLEDGS